MSDASASAPTPWAPRPRKARRFNSSRLSEVFIESMDVQNHTSPEGTVEAWGCGIGPQPSLRDSRLFGVQPSVETLGYSRVSLRDSKAAVFTRRQNAPGVQQYDLWVMT